MTPERIMDAIRATLDDAALSRAERKALKELLTDAPRSVRQALRARIFSEVAGRLSAPADRELLGWLEDTSKLLDASGERAASSGRSQVLFGPSDPIAQTIVSLLAGARRRVDVAVFTITDDRVSQALLDAHRRGVLVRILTDDDKSEDLGSDVRVLAREGLDVAMDDSPHHFHHKFAVIDRRTVLTGSYNWTRGASERNRENLLISEDPSLVGAYAQGFESLWDELGRSR